MLAATDIPSSIADFMVIKAIGQGGMGQVFLAHQPRPARDVALKVIHPHLAGDEVRARFHREANALGRLNHPNVVAVYAFGEDQGRLYLAMEHIQGRSLRTILRENRSGLPIDRAMKLGLQILSGLRHAHSRQVIHRDLKPSNILVTEVDGVETAKLVDFGLARFLDGDVNVTKTGKLVGSAPYMSPEQWEEAAVLDDRVDVYAFGVLLFEMLTGTLPFRAKTTAGFMRAHLLHEPSDPAKLRPELREHSDILSILRVALTRYPRARPSAAELRDYFAPSEPRIANGSLRLPSSSGTTPPVGVPDSKVEDERPTGPLEAGWSPRHEETAEGIAPPWLASAETGAAGALPPTETLTSQPTLDPALDPASPRDPSGVPKSPPPASETNPNAVEGEVVGLDQDVALPKPAAGRASNGLENGIESQVREDDDVSPSRSLGLGALVLLALTSAFVLGLWVYGERDPQPPLTAAAAVGAPTGIPEPDADVREASPQPQARDASLSSDVSERRPTAIATDSAPPSPEPAAMDVAVTPQEQLDAASALDSQAGDIALAPGDTAGPSEEGVAPGPSLRPTRVRVVSTPRAMLYVDGKRQGRTPHWVNIRGGQQLKLRRSGYVTLVTEVSATGLAGLGGGPLRLTLKRPDKAGAGRTKPKAEDPPPKADPKPANPSKPGLKIDELPIE